MWILGIPKTAHYSILKKYEIALTLTGKSSFDKGSNPAQNIASLIQLRNYLMHFEPEWIEIQPGIGKNGVEHKFSKMLKGKFAENPMAQKGDSFFPERCFGHGCASWAITNSIAFTDEFFRKFEMPPPYMAIKCELMTK